MSREKMIHPDEAELLMAIVDEGDLPAAVREHLSGCPSCRTARERIEADLTSIGQMAKRFSPTPRRLVRLEQEVRKPRHSWTWEWKESFRAGAAFAMALLVVLGAVFFNHSREDRKIAVLYKEMQSDERLITDVSRLEDNALPSLYLDILDDDDSDGSQGNLKPGPGSRENGAVS